FPGSRVTVDGARAGSRGPLIQERIPMPSKDSGYFNKLVRKLTSDTGELDADELSERSRADGASRACDCRTGESVTVLGRIRSVELGPEPDAATLKAELFEDRKSNV